MGQHTLAAGVLVKAESTYGTDASPSTSTDGVRFVERPEWKPGFLFDGKRDKANASNGNVQRVPPTGRFWEITHKAHAKGRGAAYTSSSVVVPDIHQLLKACGMTATVTTTGGSEKWDFTPDAISPSAATPTSVTMWGYKQGELMKATGCYGTFSVSADNTGVPVWQFDMKGIGAQNESEVTVGNITYTVPSVMPPTAAGITVDLGSSFAPVVRSFKFAMNRTLLPRQDLTSANGHSGFIPSERDPELEIVFEGAYSGTAGDGYSSSAFGLWDAWRDATTTYSAATLDVNLTIGSTQYNRWKLLCPQVQLEKFEWRESGAEQLAVCTFRPYLTGENAVDDFTIRFD